MEFELPRRELPAINLSALIDVAFILVIFIVLTASFQRMQSLDVSLPETDGTTPADTTSLVITVPAAGLVQVGEQAVPLEGVRSELIRRKAEHQAVLIRADKGAAVERAVRILNDAQRAGFRSVGIATRQAAPSEVAP